MAEIVTFSQVEVENACEIVASSLGYSSPREHQIRVMSSFVRGNDVFGVLPTGYGKSLCYVVLPVVADMLYRVLSLAYNINIIDNME